MPPTRVHLLRHGVTSIHHNRFGADVRFVSPRAVR